MIEEVKKILNQHYGESPDGMGNLYIAKLICQLITNNMALKRFWLKVRLTDNDCWEWLGAKQRLGYGLFSLNGKLTLAHRFAYESFVGEIPDGLEIDHLCRNRGCVNPNHLETVTHAENNKRGDGGLHTALANWAKTHCPHGHPFDKENTYYWRNQRCCRACRKESYKRWREKRNDRNKA